MIFEIEEIPEGGLNFDVLEGKEHFGIDQSDCALTDGVKVCGKLTKIEREVCFAGYVEAPLLVTCTRCLKRFSLQVKNKVQAHFVPREKQYSNGSEVEISETDIEKEIYEEDKIDLHGPIRDQILLEVPLILLCQKIAKAFVLDAGEIEILIYVNVKTMV